MAIFRRAGKWVGDTGAKMLTTGAVTPELTVYRGGEITDPLKAAKKVLEYRTKGLQNNNPLLEALKRGGKDVPVIDKRTLTAYLMSKPSQRTKAKSVLKPMVVAGAAGAAAAYIASKV